MYRCKYCYLASYNTSYGHGNSLPSLPPSLSLSPALYFYNKGVNPCSNMGGGIILGRNIHPACWMCCAAQSAALFWGGSGACNLVRFGVYLDQILSLKIFLIYYFLCKIFINYHFFYKNFKNYDLLYKKYIF